MIPLCKQFKNFAPRQYSRRQKLVVIYLLHILRPQIEWFLPACSHAAWRRLWNSSLGFFLVNGSKRFSMNRRLVSSLYKRCDAVSRVRCGEHIKSLGTALLQPPRYGDVGGREVRAVCRSLCRKSKKLLRQAIMLFILYDAKRLMWLYGCTRVFECEFKQMGVNAFENHKRTRMFLLQEGFSIY